uniref:OMP_b-brl_3 domain-containing protein n=1 Tax=Strongyloides venezuelensis TaxID=75913 RepID=A0A0K0G5R5_STRVS
MIFPSSGVFFFPSMVKIPPFDNSLTISSSTKFLDKMETAYIHLSIGINVQANFDRFNLIRVAVYSVFDYEVNLLE